MSEIKPCPELAEAKADIVYQAKLLLEIRRKIALFAREVEDEGDRVYFRSTNDADALRDLAEDLDHFEWERMEKGAKGRDLYAELRSARKQARELAASRDRASDACATVQRERDALRDAMQEICCQSNEDWAEARTDPNATLNRIHEIAVDAFYGKSE